MNLLSIINDNCGIKVFKERISSGVINSNQCYEEPPILYIACEDGNLEICQLLISSGANVNQGRLDNGKTPLWIASYIGYFEICQLLISSGANVNQVDTNYGRTPLWVASGRGHKEICQLLISSGANVNQPTTDNGETPLYVASHCGHKENCQILISSGANVNQATTDYGRTPLSIASCERYKEICQLLISSGANPRHESVTSFLFQLKISNTSYFTHNETIKFLTMNIRRINEEILSMTLLSREFDEYSVFHEDFLPLDLFRVILCESELV